MDRATEKGRGGWGGGGNEISKSSTMLEFYAIHGGSRTGCKGKERRRRRRKNPAANASAMHKVIKLSSSNRSDNTMHGGGGTTWWFNSRFSAFSTWILTYS